MTPDELGALLDELGRRLGPGGEYVFRLAVQKALLSAWLGLLVVGIPAALVAIWGWRNAVSGWRKEAATGNPWSDNWQDKEAENKAGGSLVVAASATVIAVLFVINCVPSILIPEYTALRDILSAIGAAR